MANHRKACRVYPAGHHQRAVFLRLIRLIVTIFNQILPNPSRKKHSTRQKKREKRNISGILIDIKNKQNFAD